MNYVQGLVTGILCCLIGLGIGYATHKPSYQLQSYEEMKALVNTVASQYECDGGLIIPWGQPDFQFGPIDDPVQQYVMRLQ